MFEIILIIILSAYTYGHSTIVASKHIYHNQQISSENTLFIEKDYSECKSINKMYIQNNYLLSTHYIKQGSVICYKDFKVSNLNTVTYKFGTYLEIEEYGKIITNTNSYIKIKKPNGKIKKVTKTIGFMQ
jgi:phage FluMu protein Com